MEFLFRFRAGVALFVFSLFCVISLGVQSSSFSLSIEGIGNGLMMPFQKGYNAVQKSVHKLWAGFTELSDVRNELTKTREKLQKLEGTGEELSQIKNENNQLRELLGMQSRVGFDVIPAMIISKDPDNWFRTIIINRGTNDGVEKNMPVIAYNGDLKAIVGKIIEVRGSISRILPIISQDMKVGIMMMDSRYPGLLVGYSANDSLCRIDYLSRNAQINPGDMVITSGQAGIFPQGILVGNIIKNSVNKYGSFQQALVKPIIDFNQLEQVYILKVDMNQDIQDIIKDEQ